MSNEVYKAIAAVAADMATNGIEKCRKNQQQGYSFRGIDDVYNALAPVLARHGLCFLPRILSRSVEERASKNGGVLFYVTVEAEFDLVAAADGSKHTIRTFGEAMDSADKATNKAMSAAYKYAAMQTFCIPTEGDNDADAATPEPAAAPPQITKKQLPSIIQGIKDCASIADLQSAFASAYRSSSGEIKQAILAEYNKRKIQITEADHVIA